MMMMTNYEAMNCLEIFSLSIEHYHHHHHCQLQNSIVDHALMLFVEQDHHRNFHHQNYPINDDEYNEVQYHLMMTMMMMMIQILDDQYLNQVND